MPLPSEFTDEELKTFEEGGTPFVEGETLAAPAEEVVPVLSPAAAEPGVVEPAPVAAPVAGEVVAPPAAEPAMEPVVEPDTRTVPLAALHAERSQRQQLARENAAMTARLNALLSSRAEAVASSSPADLPDMDKDPAGYLKALEGLVLDMRSERQNSGFQSELDNAITADEESFKAVQPDYPRAAEHYVNSRAQELLTFHTPEEAKEILTSEARQVARQAWNRGITMGQAIYNLAKARGYTPGAAPTPDPAPAPAVVPASPAAIVEAVNKGAASSRSMSGAGGGGSPTMTAEAVLNMSDEDFAAFLKLDQKGANARFQRVLEG